ncbi:putative UPF0674 endoplasmic reticulum membrane protein [Xylogone sp. PMI_703]|nr:putative UPF0674 endoplasmic reticulum membrane protein [Xylogone sp. PMI_703]
MANVLGGLFGGSKPSASPVSSGDADFADFAEAGSSQVHAAGDAAGTSAAAAAASSTGSPIPYTKWYNIHERYTWNDFQQEGIILVIVFVMVAVHLYGTRTNRSKAKKWSVAIAPVLQREFASVGFTGRSTEGLESQELAKKLLKEKSPQDFATYATGRQNVAFVDINLSLLKRYNPFALIMDYGLSLFFDSMPAPVERMQTIIYPFDGKESLTVPQLPGAQELRKDNKSSYDGFVWAIVHKDTMKQLRDERYDVSITTTKDNAKLPVWTTVMTESAEITDALLTPELVAAVEQAGDLLEHLIVTDQPIDKPLTLDDTTPKKRLYLSVKLPSSDDYSSILPLFDYFLRLPDILVQSAHFRPEVMRKVRATREETIRRLQKADEEGKAEERALEREKAKKLKRDLELKGLDAKAQKKYLEKEKEKELRKSQKKQTMRA